MVSPLLQTNKKDPSTKQFLEKMDWMLCWSFLWSFLTVRLFVWKDVSYSNFVVAKISYRHPLWFVLKAELLLHKAAILD